MNSRITSSRGVDRNEEGMAMIVTLGDSVLDCARYNEHGATPGGLLAENDDALFPAFRGRDLATLLGRQVGVDHRAEDGATVERLPAQLTHGPIPRHALALLSIGGNDLLQAFLGNGAFDLRAFAGAVRNVLERLRETQLFVATVYDPTGGDHGRNWLRIDPRRAWAAHARVNAVLIDETARVGGCLVDLHAHFLTGAADWFTQRVEPSLVGASEVRRAFLQAWERRR
jgi:hypothetical protein